MSIQRGTQLGPYEILDLIGAGGMGEVYRATDKRLNRDIALKVLPKHFSDNPEMKQRFEREAQTIAGLNHPHICTLHDVGRQDGVDYLVMELLEGETLAMRLERGALPLDEALKAAIQIADALEKAHRQGVVHRDLKPSNVMLTRSGAKLLDFGLAKLKSTVQPATMSGIATNVNVTAQGAIVGTLQYMSPEQLEGAEADTRSDVFAFGALLYEMLSGRKAFEGRSQASLISAIMTAEPQPLAQAQPVMPPPALEHVVRTCLQKEPDDRWQTIHDLLVQLKWLAAGRTQTTTTTVPLAQAAKRQLLPWTLFAIVTLLALFLALPAILYFRGTTPLPETRLSLNTPPITNPFLLAVSPDGRRVAFVAANGPEGTAIFIREFGSTDVRPLPGTDLAQSLFWSPDGRSIGFIGSGTLKRIDLAGGPPQTIGNINGVSVSGAWSKDGTILFMAKNVLYRISESGGEAQPVTELDEAKRETGQMWPFFLPDGRHFLYTSLSGQESKRGIYIGSLDSKETQLLINVPSQAAYATGNLFYQRGGTLFAHAFNATSLALSGEPTRIADQIASNATNGRAAFTVSQTGTLVYREGPVSSTQQRFSWFDRDGKDLGPAADPGPYLDNFALSADAKQLAVSISDNVTNQSDVWLIDLSRKVTSRLTYDGFASARDVIWSPDGSVLAFTSREKTNADIVVKKANGVGEPQSIVDSPNDEFAEDWSQDGRYIVYGAWAPTPTDIWAVPLSGDRKPFPVVQSPFRKDEPHLSYDGKWLAYGSEDSGRWQIYLTPFPAADQKRQISVGGGAQPRWRRDGKELYFMAPDGKMMAVEMNPGDTFGSGVPHPLFDTGLTFIPNRDQYAVTSDGQRFLILKPVGAVTPSLLTVVFNWTPPKK